MVVERGSIENPCVIVIFCFFIDITSLSTINHNSEATNNTMAMVTTNNNETMLKMMIVKSPLKCLHNEWRCFGHLKHPNEAANGNVDFVKVLAAHGVCHGLTVQ